MAPVIALAAGSRPDSAPRASGPGSGVGPARPGDTVPRSSVVTPEAAGPAGPNGPPGSVANPLKGSLTDKPGTLPTLTEGAAAGAAIGPPRPCSPSACASNAAGERSESAESEGPGNPLSARPVGENPGAGEGAGAGAGP